MSDDHCPECGFEAKTRATLKQHFSKKHPDVPAPWPPAPVSIPHPKTASDLPAELVKVEKQFAESIGMIGGLIAGALGEYKSYWVMSGGEGQAKLPRTNISAPYLETTFGHVVATQAPMSARIIMPYAANNPALLSAIEAFNSFMHGGEGFKVISAHVVGLAHTVQPNNDRINNPLIMSMVGEEVIAKVMQENKELKELVERLQRESQQPAAGDERGQQVA